MRRAKTRKPMDQVKHQSYADMSNTDTSHNINVRGYVSGKHEWQA